MPPLLSLYRLDICGALAESRSIAKDSSFTIRLTGEGVRPSLLAASDLAALLVAAEQTVAALIQHDHPEMEGAVVIGLSGINETSIGFVFTSNFPELARSGFENLISALEKRQFANLPARSLDGLRVLTLFTRERNGHTQFWRGGGNHFFLDLPPDFSAEIPKPNYLRGETVIFGKAEGVRGIRPQVRIRISDQEFAYADITEEQGRELSRLLHQKIGLHGHAVWDARDGSIVSFKVIEIVSHKPTSAKAAFEELASLADGAYDEIHDIDWFARQVREGDEP